MDSTQDEGHPPQQYFDSLRFGVFKSFQVRGASVDGGAMVNTRAWNYAAENGLPIGDCRRCGYHMYALPTQDTGHLRWFTAECRNCGAEIASPNGEMLLRSGRHDEMPRGFWDGRKGKS